MEVKMKNRYSITFILSFSILLFSCDGGPKDNSNPVDQGNNGGATQASIANGQIYYETNCGDCHSAGTTDPSKAFNASDLKLSTRITSNMSNNTVYGGTNGLMKRFSAIPQHRIDELKAYLGSIN